MKLFRRQSKTTAQTGPPPAEMRGRAGEIADPAALGWEVVWEALKTEPPAENAATITQELGLDTEQDIIQSFGGLPATEFSGTRHGRQVALRMGVVPGVRAKGYNEVRVTTSVAPFRIREDGGRLVVEPGAVPDLEAALSELSPSPDVWRKLEVDGGPDGILARRPVTAHSQGYVYDLWLLEHIADRLGA
jgi:hypothetical protein